MKRCHVPFVQIKHIHFIIVLIENRKKTCSYCNQPSHTEGACSKKGGKVNFVRSIRDIETESMSDMDIVKLLQLTEEHESSCAVQFVSFADSRFSMEEEKYNLRPMNIYSSKVCTGNTFSKAVHVPTGFVRY